ncbi:MAG: methyl-accepting chemotaxis protein [Meiothermus sp.]|nr:methyl-accepting chemotaxis protein [Meiothermus sp.]
MMQRPKPGDPAPKPPRKALRLPGQALPTTMFRVGGVLGTLKIWQKLLLVVLAFAIPLAFSVGLLIRNDNAIINFSVKEILGTQYLQKTRAVYNYTHMHRFLSSAYLSGDRSVAAQRQETAANLDKALTELEAIDRQMGATLETGDTVVNLREAWSRLRQEGDGLSPVQSTRRHTFLVETYLKPLMVQVGNTSNLVLDPDIDSYYLMSAVVQIFPFFWEDVGLVRAGGIAAASRPRNSSDQRAELRVQYRLVQRQLDDLRRSLNNTMQASGLVAREMGPVLEQMEDSLTNLLSAYSEQIAGVEQPTISRADYRALALTNFEVQFKAFEVGLTTLEKLLQNRVQRLQQQQLTQLALVALAFAITLLLAGIISRRIVEPLSSLYAASSRLAQGNLNVQVPVLSSDEIGSLTRSFNDTVVQLKQKAEADAEKLRQTQLLQQNIGDFLNVAMNIAQGDLTQRGRVTEDVLGNVVDAVNLTVDEIGYLLKQVQQAAEQVNQGAGSVNHTTNNILMGAKSQTEAAGQAASQSFVVTQSIRELTQNAETTAEAARLTLEASTKGQEALENTLAGMQSIRREAQNISRSVKGLSDRSQEISQVVDTIDDIAKQTNLLALNATLEAAGAGEAGVRFAVVARQVRKLAEDTAKSTLRVSNLVKGIQTEIQGLVLSVDGSTREVEQGYRIASEAGERLREIAELANQSARLAQIISSAAQQQVAGIEQVGRAVQTIAQTAAETEQQSARGQEAAEGLRELSSQLTQSLSRFRLSS